MNIITLNHKSNIGRKPRENGESIEAMLRRLTANKQPIPENVPKIFTEKQDGVIPDYDIRTDRFDVAIEAQDKFAASEIAKGANKGQDTDNQLNNDKE